MARRISSGVSGGSCSAHLAMAAKSPARRSASWAVAIGNKLLTVSATHGASRWADPWGVTARGNRQAALRLWHAARHNTHKSHQKQQRWVVSARIASSAEPFCHTGAGEPLSWGNGVTHNGDWSDSRAPGDSGVSENHKELGHD